MKTIASLLVLLTAVGYAADAPTPKTATKNAPFVNSLGMKFVPVEITGGPTNGKRVLFSIWDTRVQDYAEYAKAKGVTPAKADFEQGPTHPVSSVSWDDAKSFCEWLTAKERANGRIGARDEYRLPLDHEWSCAVGIGKLEKAEESPESKSGKITIYPWGTQWPPPKGAGNYASSLHVDEFRFTSPVGSFEANEYGLYDMGGNVGQWCEDWYDAKQERRVMRGASWNPADELYLRSTFRLGGVPSYRYVDSGFRCVLAVDE
jgi:formylglycine-generating enzyme required for sulfatase activity